MIFLTRWVPDSESSTPILLYAFNQLVTQGIEPDLRVDASWTRDSIVQQSKLPPLAADAIWESILAIWCLRRALQEGGGRDVWTKLVVAWIVRLLVDFFPNSLLIFFTDPTLRALYSSSNRPYSNSRQLHFSTDRSWRH